eukprot:sb/3473373/
MAPFDNHSYSPPQIQEVQKLTDTVEEGSVVPLDVESAEPGVQLVDNDVQPSVEVDTDVQQSLEVDTDVQPSLEVDTDVQQSLEVDTDVQQSLDVDTEINVRPSLDVDTDVQPSLEVDTESDVQQSSTEEVVLSQEEQTVEMMELITSQPVCK